MSRVSALLFSFVMISSASALRVVEIQNHGSRVLLRMLQGLLRRFRENGIHAGPFCGLLYFDSEHQVAQDRDYLRRLIRHPEFRCEYRQFRLNCPKTSPWSYHQRYL